MQLVKSQFHNKVEWQALLKSGDRLFIGSNTAVPNALMESLIQDAADIVDLEIVHIANFSACKWATKEFADRFKVNTFFIHSDNVRIAVDDGRADYTPCFLSEVSQLFNDETLPLDVALIMVAPPDELGYCSLGTSVDIVMSAARSAKHIVAQVNPNMPQTCGHSFLHISEFSACVTHPEPMPVLQKAEPSKITERIGQYVSLLIDNGATLQLGIGTIPEAVTHYLDNHKDLGVHSEMISDGVMYLMRKRIVSNRKKTFHPGKTVTSFCAGSEDLYKFVEQNPHVEFYPSSYVNKPTNIAKNDNMISINSALQIDLTGQVVADSIGHDFYSGIGGQVDFVSGASMSKGGKSIIALPATAKDKSVSRIVAELDPGSGVVTSRGNVDYVVTEFGIARLRGKSIRERALELIRIAHPAFREELLDAVRKHLWVPDYQLRYPTDIAELGDMQIIPVEIKGEKFYLRPLNPADERRLQEFFYSHTKETLRLRYNSVPQAMTREKSCDLVSVDQTKDLALTIAKQQGSSIVIEAVGRYYLYPQDNACEVAFVTRETQQGKGMAKLLLNKMIDIAKRRDLTRMFALVKTENTPMLSVFDQFGFKRTANSDAVDTELVLQLGESNAD